MIVGLLDTSIIVDLVRNVPVAIEWFQAQGVLGYSEVAWLEIIQGARAKVEQRKVLETLNLLHEVQFTSDDMLWAKAQLLRLTPSHGTEAMDAMIASAAARLNLPLYTQNVRHFTPLLGALAIQPYRYPI